LRQRVKKQNKNFSIFLKPGCYRIFPQAVCAVKNCLNNFLEPSEARQQKRLRKLFLTVAVGWPVCLCALASLKQKFKKFLTVTQGFQ